MSNGEDRGSMIHVSRVPGSKELQAEMKLQRSRTTAFAAPQICQPADPGVCCLWIALMMCEHTELAGAEIWGDSVTLLANSHLPLAWWAF